MQIPLRPLALVSAAILLASCANDGGSSRSSTSGGPRSFSERLNESNGYKQDSEGNWVPKSDRRSSFETNRDSAYFKGNVKKREYQTGDFKKKSWWGNREHARTEYQANTDGSRFQTRSDLQGRGAREGGSRASLPGNYQTGDYATNAARENGAGRLDKPSDAETDVRRRVFVEPEIIDWREQRAMNIEQTKSILGRN